jgi:hypothetical protein
VGGALLRQDSRPARADISSHASILVAGSGASLIARAP